MYSAIEIYQSFQQDTKGTSEFRAFLERAFESIEELNCKTATRITPVVPIGQGRVKDLLEAGDA